MDREGAKKVLKVLRATYPNTFRNMDRDEATDAVDVYASIFKDIPDEIVVEALMAYIRNEEYAPTPAGLFKYIKGFSGETDYEKMFKELWSAICGNRKFTDLCPENQKYIGSQQALDMMGLDENTLMDVVRGQYMKRIPAIVEQMRFEENVTKSLGEERVNTLKAILSGHRKTDELPEYTIGELARRNG